MTSLQSSIWRFRFRMLDVCDVLAAAYVLLTNHWKTRASRKRDSTTARMSTRDTYSTTLEAMQPTVSVSTVPTLMASSRHSALALSPDDWRALVASRPRKDWIE